MTATARRAALAALATATALGATVLTAPAFAAEPPKQGEASAPVDASKLGGASKPVEAPSSNDASRLELKDGKLEWGVKQSLRDDIKGGKVTVTGAPQAKDGGVFTFGEGKGTDDKSTGVATVTFKDGVHFQGDAEHGYKLDLKLSDLKVVTATKEKKGEITATVTKNGGKPQENVVIATLEHVDRSTKGGVHTFKKISAKLTAAGAEAFAHTDGEKPYKEGDELDSLDFSVKAATAEPTDNGGSTGNEGNNTGNQGGANGGEQGKDTENKGKEGEQKAPAKVVDGNLDWGLSDTFRKYIDNTSGKATVSGGAKRFKEGYRFSKGSGSYNATDSSLKAKFAGEVRFTARGGDVDLKLTDLQVEVKGKTGTVTATTNRSTEPIPFAKLALPGDFPKAKDGVVTLSAVPATLTPEGAAALTFKNDTIVKSGDALDPLTVNVATDKNAKLPDMPSDTSSDKSTDTTTNTGATATNTSTTTGGTGSTATTGGTATATDTTASGTLASTGANTPTGPLLGGAAALIAVGGGAVYAARRRKAGQQG